MPSFSSSRLRVSGLRSPNNARWISSELKRPASGTTILSPSSSHSRTEPGPMPSFRRTSTGTEICPYEVTLECAIAIPISYQGIGMAGQSLLEVYADAIFLTAVDEFQVFHFLVFHRKEEEAGDRLFDLLFRQHLGVEEFLERVLRVLLALLRAGFDAGVLGAGAGADSAHCHAADTPAAAALGALTAGAVVAGKDEPATAGHLVGRHRLGAIAILIRAQDEIVAVDGDFLGVLGLHFDLRHNVVPPQIVAERFLDGCGVDINRDVEDQVFVFAATGSGGLFGGAGDQKSRSKEERNKTRDHGQILCIDYSGWYNISLPPIPGAIPKMDEKERSRALELALSQIEKQFGKGSILRLGSKDAIVPVSVISTGSISLDAALGVGGFPRGRAVEVFGPESSGKTTIALQVIAEAQKKGGIAAFIDVEHALDPGYARKLGVDVDNLLVSQPDYGEQALEITNHLTSSGQIDVLVVDSVAALVPKAELDGEMGDSHMGLQARLMSQALRKLTGVVSKSRTCLIFINQIREKIGVMFGNPETTTGGRALKFYASIRVDIRRIAAIKDGDVVIGNRTKVKVVKNKVAAPFREAEFDIIYGEGISREGDVLDLGVAQNLIEKSGSWYSYKGDRIGQGRENARQFLKDNADIRQGIDTELRRQIGLLKPEADAKVPCRY